MPLAKDDMSANAMGGTELMKNGLMERLGEEALAEFQLFASRVQEPLDETKIRILWLHDLPGDPASDVLKDGGWKNFHKLVFTSNWQMQAYINFYQIPWSRCIVLQNAIEPIEFTNDARDGSNTINLIYTPTPHRGLNILVPVFDKMCERYDNLELSVYSSFKLYGWGERDKEFSDLFKQIENHPKMHYYSSVPNAMVRDALTKSHIFAYPSTWPETSCLSLMEAMSAGCLCVHSNFAALPETAANWTHMYHYNEDLNEHAKMFYTVLCGAIDDLVNAHGATDGRLRSVKSYVDIFYGWSNRVMQWQALLGMLLNTVQDRGLPREEFVYRV